MPQIPPPVLGGWFQILSTNSAYVDSQNPTNCRWRDWRSCSFLVIFLLISFFLFLAFAFLFLFLRNLDLCFVRQRVITFNHDRFADLQSFSNFHLVGSANS